MGNEETEFMMGHKVGIAANYLPKDPEHYRDIYMTKAMPYLRIETPTPNEMDVSIATLKEQLREKELQLRQQEYRLRKLEEDLQKSIEERISLEFDKRMKSLTKKQLKAILEEEWRWRGRRRNATIVDTSFITAQKTIFMAYWRVPIVGKHISFGS